MGWPLSDDALSSGAKKNHAYYRRVPDLPSRHDWFATRSLRHHKNPELLVGTGKQRQPVRIQRRAEHARLYGRVIVHDLVGLDDVMGTENGQPHTSVFGASGQQEHTLGQQLLEILEVLSDDSGLLPGDIFNKGRPGRAIDDEKVIQS